MRDSEETSLPPDAPEIEDVHRLFTLEDPVVLPPRDIVDIIQSCMKDVKKMEQHNPTHAIKLLIQLMAVSEYIKKRDIYMLSNACKQPCLRASIVIANQMGKGVYFARQICHNTLYLLKHHRLPPCKEYTCNGQYSILDNEAVLHSILYVFILQPSPLVL
jgi:hypothetical protein